MTVLLQTDSAVDDSRPSQVQLDSGQMAKVQAAGSSFYAGMRVLPKPERQGMYAVYGFCRQVDDIADDLEGLPEDRREALDHWRADIDALYAGGTPPRAAFLAEPIRRFGLDRADFQAVIDGMQMDVDTTIRAPSLSMLDLYCDRVASAVGRLSVKVFGMDEVPGAELAHHLGRALQLTNILRDLDEDAAIGRLYLPRELLDAAGIEGDDPLEVVDDARIDVAACALARMAQDHYAAANRILAARPKGRLIAPRLMSAVYCRILSRMEKAGWTAPRERVSVGKPELLWLVVRRGLIG